MPKQTNFNTNLERIQNYFLAEHNLPWFRKAMEVIKVKSTSVVHRFYLQLAEEWFVRKVGGVYEATEKLWAMPYFRSISAGFPGTTSQIDREAMNIQSYLVTSPAKTMIIKVQWDSMQDAGIMSGDMVVVNTGLGWNLGDIVVAQVDGEFTLKYLAEDGKWDRYLLAGNPNYPAIYPEWELLVKGVVTGSFRRFGSE